MVLCKKTSTQGLDSQFKPGSARGSYGYSVISGAFFMGSWEWDTRSFRSDPYWLDSRFRMLRWGNLLGFPPSVLTPLPKSRWWDCGQGRVISWSSFISSLFWKKESRLLFSVYNFCNRVTWGEECAWECGLWSIRNWSYKSKIISLCSCKFRPHPPTQLTDNICLRCLLISQGKWWGCL